MGKLLSVSTVLERFAKLLIFMQKPNSLPVLLSAMKSSKIGMACFSAFTSISKSFLKQTKKALLTNMFPLLLISYTSFMQI